MVGCSKEAFICKECGCIIDEKDLAVWTQPSASTKVAVLFGHSDPDFTHCTSGKQRRLENYSAGQLMINITHEVFFKFNYLGQMNWYELPNDYLYLTSTTEQTIVENSLHTGLVLAVEDLGEVVVNLPTVTDFPPYGLDIFVSFSSSGTCVKIQGFPIDIYLKSRNNNVLACWCGNEVGWQISNGNYLTSPPA